MTTALRSIWQATFGWEQRQKFWKTVEPWLPDRFRYGHKFYELLDQAVSRSVPFVSEDLIREFSPTSVVDVGCGNGWLLSALKNREIQDLQGFEFSSSGIKQTKKRGIPAEFLNLKHPLKWHRVYDLCTCVEVAEHVDSEYADQIVDTLVGLAPVVVFTAAIPGQGGVNHVNEQPHEYWVEKFEQHSMRFDHESTKRLREKWSSNDEIAPWYGNNAMVFFRDSSKGESE